MAITTLTCPTGCEDLVLPNVEFDDCNPVNKLSQIIYAYVALAEAANFTAADVVDEWTDRLSENATPPSGSGTEVVDLIRPLTVTGDIPAPTISERDISGGRKVTTKTDRVVNLEIDEATALNYEFARQTECGYFKCKMWFETAGGILLGGNTGITGKLVLNPIFARGTDEIEKYIGTFTWDSKASPDRCVSPIAH